MITIEKNPTKNFLEFKNAIKSNVESYKEIVENFEFIEEPKEIEISKNKGIVCVYKYSIKTQEGEIVKIKSRGYSIPNGSYFLNIEFIDGQIDEDCTNEFNELIKTIKIKWNK